MESVGSKWIALPAVRMLPRRNEIDIEEVAGVHVEISTHKIKYSSQDGPLTRKRTGKGICPALK